MKWIAVITFVSLAVAANWLTSAVGPVSFAGLTVAAGTFTAGLVLLVRDGVQEAGGRWFVLGAILAGSVVSWWVSAPALALASGAAFAVSEVADATVYTPLRRRGWGRAAFVSGIIGSIVDTLVFLWLAASVLRQFDPRFSFASATAGQLVVKIGMTAIVVGAVKVSGALLRDRVRTASA